jgi:hypothetical protein
VKYRPPQPGGGLPTMKTLRSLIFIPGYLPRGDLRGLVC